MCGAGLLAESAIMSDQTTAGLVDIKSQLHQIRSPHLHLSTQPRHLLRIPCCPSPTLPCPSDCTLVLSAACPSPCRAPHRAPHSTPHPDCCPANPALAVPLQLRHPCMPWDLEHLLQFQWSSKVVLTTPSGLELKGGLFKVRQVLRDGAGALQEGNDVVL